MVKCLSATEKLPILFKTSLGVIHNVARVEIISFLRIMFCDYAISTVNNTIILNDVNIRLIDKYTYCV